MYMVESENGVEELYQNMDDHCSECVNSSDKRSKSIDHGLTEKHKASITEFYLAKEGQSKGRVAKPRTI